MSDVEEPLQFSSPEISLAEAHRRYDNEEMRRDGLENKISILVTVNTLIITLPGPYNDISISERLFSIFPALVSAVIGLLLVAPQLYAKPVQDKYYDYAQMEENEAYDTLFASYIHSISHNIYVNRFKFFFFRICIFLTLLSIILVFSVPFLPVIEHLQLFILASPLIIDIYYGINSVFLHLLTSLYDRISS